MIARFNERLALLVTSAVGTMWCAYVFAALALISLPGVLGFSWLPDRTVLIVAWIAQTFLQLVLLSVILVGQNIQGTDHADRHEATHDKLDTILGHLGGIGEGK
jgi:hypothetical protein